MKKNIWIFLLSFMTFLSVENLQAASKGPTIIDSSDEVFPKITPLKTSKPLDYFAINTNKDGIVASLWNGTLVSRDSVMKLLENIPEDEPCTDKAAFTASIDSLGDLMISESLQRREDKGKQDNIHAFVAMLKGLAEIEPMGKIQEALSLILQFY